MPGFFIKVSNVAPADRTLGYPTHWNTWKIV